VKRSIEFEYPDVGSVWGKQSERNGEENREYFICKSDSVMDSIGGAEFSDTVVSGAFGRVGHGRNGVTFCPMRGVWEFYAESRIEFMEKQAQELIEKNEKKLTYMKSVLRDCIKEAEAHERANAGQR